MEGSGGNAMNKIVINRDSINKDYFDCDNLQSILEKIKADLLNEKKIVCSLRVNNDYLTDAIEDENINFKLKDLHLIEIEYCSEDIFYIEFLDSTTAFLTDLINICPHMSEKIYENSYNEFNLLFTDFLGSMDSVTTALVYIQEHLPSSQEKAWRALEVKLSAVLQQTLEVFSKKDYVVLADLIEYEMMEVLRDWHKIIIGLKEFANERPNKIER